MRRLQTLDKNRGHAAQVPDSAAGRKPAAIWGYTRLATVKALGKNALFSINNVIIIGIRN